MPLKRFWLFNKSIDRIASESDLRAIKVSTAKLSNDIMRETLESLKIQMGSIVEFMDAGLDRVEDGELDVEGLMGLKNLG